MRISSLKLPGIWTGAPPPSPTPIATARRPPDLAGLRPSLAQNGPAHPRRGYPLPSRGRSGAAPTLTPARSTATPPGAPCSAGPRRLREAGGGAPGGVRHCYRARLRRRAAGRPGGLPAQHRPGRERRREAAREVRKASATPAAIYLSPPAPVCSPVPRLHIEAS
ncbi:unnamed protein product [Urochloa humidicola]